MRIWTARCHKRRLGQAPVRERGVRSQTMRVLLPLLLWVCLLLVVLNLLLNNRTAETVAENKWLTQRARVSVTRVIGIGPGFTIRSGDKVSRHGPIGDKLRRVPLHTGNLHSAARAPEGSKSIRANVKKL